MDIIAILNSKGGVGKTTIATNLAGEMSARGLKVLLVDSTRQGSIMDWAEVRSEHDDLVDVATESLPSPKKLNGVKRRETTYDHIILDCDGRLDALIVSAVKVADAVIIPVRPNAFDLWAVVPVIRIIKEHQQWMDGAFRGVKRLHGYLCFSQVCEDADLTDQVQFVNEDLGFSLLSTKIQLRADYADATQVGKSVVEFNPRGEAASEVRALTSEILSILQ